MDLKKFKYQVKCYGSCTVGDRGQIVLPVDARKRFNIKPGDKLIVVSADNENFEKVVLLKSDSMAKMFSVLAAENINIRLISTSEIRISCVIDEKYAELAVRELHTAFGLDNE